MFSNLFSVSKKSWATFFTMVVIGLGYAYYFFVYVKNNEIEYNDKAHRILAQLGKNISGINTNYEGNLKILVSQLPSDLAPNEENELRDIEVAIKRYEKELIQLKPEIEQLKRDDKAQESKNQFKTMYVKQDNIRKLLEARDKIKESKTKKSKEMLAELTGKYNLEKISGEVYDKDRKTDPDYVYYAFDSSYFRTSIQGFVKPFSKQSYFDHYLIIRDNSENIAYQSFNNRISINHMDSLLLHEGAFTSSASREIHINDRLYKVYLHQINFCADENWIIAGCIDKDKYVDKTRTINPWLVLYTSIIILVLLISMPLLKLALMSQIERLHMHNVFLTGLSIVIGTPLIVLSFLILYNYYGHDIPIIDNHLNQLKSNINDSFFTEINDAYTQLEMYDDSLYHFLNEEELSTEAETRGEILKYSFPFYHYKYPYYNEVFWLNQNGDQIFQFNTSSETNPLINLKKRKYFALARDSVFWKVPKVSISEGEKYFAMQSITSWTTGYPEIAISKKSQWPSLAVAVITSKLNSVMDVVLPLGYHFVIVDQDGNVLVHSDVEKSNQENFFLETENNPLILAAINNHISITTNIHYMESEFRAKITPMNELPINLIVFYDLEHVKTKISEIWFFALILIVISFIGTSLLLAVDFFRTKKGVLEYRRFVFNWMKPSEDLVVCYANLIVSNILSVLFVLLVTVIFNFNWFGVSNYAVESVENAFRITLLPLIVFAITYVKIKFHKTGQIELKFILTAGLVLLCVNFIHLFFFGFKWFDYVFQFVIIWLYVPEWTMLTRKVKQTFEGLRMSYSMMLFVWLVNTSVIPVYYFYNISYAQESTIWAKHQLMTYVHDVENHYNSTESEIAKIASHKYHDHREINKEIVNQKFKTGIYPLTIDEKKSLGQREDYTFSNSLMFYLRPSFRNIVNENRGLVYPKSSDNKYVWYRKDTIGVDYIQIGYNYQFPKLNIQPNTIQASIAHNDISFVNFENSFNYWGLLFIGSVGFLVFLYCLVRFSANRIYAMESIFGYKNNSFLSKNLLKQLCQNNLLLIGLANSGRTSTIMKMLENQSFIKLNLITINNEEIWNKKVEELDKMDFEIVLLDNFEYEYHDHHSNNLKLRLLEKLLVNKKMVIVITETDPKEIIDFYLHEIRKSDDIEKTNEYKTDLETWRHIFSSFVKLYNTLEKQAVKVNLDNKVLLETVEEELCYGTYLPNVIHVIEDRKDYYNHLQDKQMMILEIQHLAQPYYSALWNTLTSEERFVTYDLAKDDFVNIKNKNVIMILLKKGLVKYDHKLCLFNESFRNFVLMSNKEEALKMEKVVKQKGAWSSIRTVLVLFIVSLIALMGFGQPDFLKNINSVVIVITGIVTFLPTLNSMFSITQRMKQNGD